jgi:hypothetical protein
LGQELETDYLIEPAVAWLPYGEGAAAFDENGDPVVGEGISIMSRWKLGTQDIGQLLSGNQNIVGTVRVDRPIPVNSILWRGEKSTLPRFPHDLVKVVESREVSDVKGRNKSYSVVVQRTSDRVPGK